ncbi:MAG: GTPase Era [Firmicutes bacterium]|nr:GTPase Era [Bacillota bacterium]
MSEQATPFRSGFVALLGRPNAGKSTLINRLVGAKVAICSDKPQTTRNSIRGICNAPGMQAVFIDTPGVHKPKFRLGERMMEAVRDSLSGCDLILYLSDVTDDFGPGDEYILRLLSELRTPVFLVLNKVDAVEKNTLLPRIALFAEKYDFDQVFPCSALTGENVDELLQAVKEALPEGPRYYPEDMCSDFPENMLVAELVREQILRLTTDEVPHAVAVTVPAMEERDNGTLYVEANIYVERESQKGIIIGKKGAMLKQIGQAARAEIERIFGCKVWLELRVRAKKDWRNDQQLLDSWDLTANGLDGLE